MVCRLGIYDGKSIRFTSDDIETIGEAFERVKPGETIFIRKEALPKDMKPGSYKVIAIGDKAFLTPIPWPGNETNMEEGISEEVIVDVWRTKTRSISKSSKFIGADG